MSANAEADQKLGAGWLAGGYIPGVMTVNGHPRIASDPAICGGRPTVAGTRVRVSDVLEMLAGGASEAEIVGDFPYLGVEDIRACLAYAAGAADHPIVSAAAE
jgi:uncharacterized protein (DUF433 family)